MRRYAECITDLNTRAKWTKEAINAALEELAIASTTKNTTRISEIQFALTLLKNDYIELLENLIQDIKKSN